MFSVYTSVHEVAIWIVFPLLFSEKGAISGDKRSCPDSWEKRVSRRTALNHGYNIIRLSPYSQLGAHFKITDFKRS